MNMRNVYHATSKARSGPDNIMPELKPKDPKAQLQKSNRMKPE
jgi:hypothetical protein